MPYRTIDLCAGIGGIRRGFEMTGHFVNVLSSEIDEYACKTYEHLFGDNPKNDLTSIDFKKKVKRTDYDVLLAGFPCQTFSAVGNKEGFKDQEKGVIFTHIAEIIKQTRPKAIFLENVENLIRHDEGKTFNIIVKTLETRLNYKIIGLEYDEDGSFIINPHNFIRNSRYFGVPQNRPRTYIMAFDRKRYKKEVLNELGQLPERNNEIIYADLNDGLLEYGADIQYYMSQGYLDTLIAHRQRESKKGNGFGYKIVNESSREHPIANTILATGGSGKERNLIKKCIRVMTPTEWGKLQGFINYAFLDENGVDHFSFPDGLSKQQKYKQFGNSVTIPLVKTMAQFMYDCFVILEDDQI